MNDPLAQYRINTNWRHHVHRFAKKKQKDNKNPITALEYCDGDAAYAKALDEWLEFMKEEERFVFYVHFVSQSLVDANRSLQLLIDRSEGNSPVRMPLLRDVFTCYSRPFKFSFGQIGIKYRLEEDIGIPEPREVHEKVIHDRDRLYAHCDLSARHPRVSKFGISLRGAGYYWDDYVKMLPSISDVINNAIALVDIYIKDQGMHDIEAFFAKFESSSDLTEQKPEFLNNLYGYE